MCVCVCVAGEFQHSAITPGSLLEGGGGGGAGGGVLGKQGGSREEPQTQRLMCSLPAGPPPPPTSSRLRPPLAIVRLLRLVHLFFFSFKDGTIIRRGSLAVCSLLC